MAAVGPLAFGGVPPPKLEFNLTVEAPHVTAARMAREMARNVHPDVSRAGHVGVGRAVHEHA